MTRKYLKSLYNFFYGKTKIGGNEVINPFEVTEVYVILEGGWKLDPCCLQG